MLPPAPNRAQAVADLLGRVHAHAALSFPEPHTRVLEAAMQLMGERGYAGASLRELARRLQMSQPSLYHYFDSKAQLVEQIVQCYAARAMRLPDDVPPAPSLSEGLRYALRRMITNYRDPEHRAFIRFLLAVGRERPEVQLLGRELMIERGKGLLTSFVELCAHSGELPVEDSRHLVDLVSDAMLMRLLGQCILYPDAEPGPELERFADFVVQTAMRGVQAPPSVNRPEPPPERPDPT